MIGDISNKVGGETDKILEAFAGTRKAGSIASAALVEVAKIVKPGVTTEQIDKLCYAFINDHKAYSAPLFYRGYPKSCCTSANHIVCHGIPKDKVLLSHFTISNLDSLLIITIVILYNTIDTKLGHTFLLITSSFINS